jgi:hypothetical protein
LRDASASGGVERGKSDHHIQRLEIAFQITSLVLELGATGIVLIELRPRQILLRKTYGLEVASGAQCTGVERGIVGKFRNGNFRQSLTHKVTFDGIVIEKDHGFQPKRKLIGNRPDVAGLVFPIGLKDRDVVFAKQHFWMLLERQPPDLVFIFRANGKDNSPASEIESHFLHSEKSLSGRVSLGDLNALETIIADDASPERVIQIQNQAAPAPASQRSEDSTQVLGVKWNKHV